MIHEKLKQLRKAMQLSQEEIAEIFNMSQNCYSKIETGKTKLDNDRIIEFAAFFKVEPSELLISKKGQIVTKELMDGPNTGGGCY